MNEIIEFFLFFAVVCIVCFVFSFLASLVIVRFMFPQRKSNKETPLKLPDDEDGSGHTFHSNGR